MVEIFVIINLLTHKRIFVMDESTSIIDNSKVSKFHIQTTIAGSAGQLCDGYLLGIIAPALPLFIAHHNASPALVGMIGASTLLGIFFGAMFFGRLTDKYGRRKLFIIDLLIIVLLSLSQLAIESAFQLLLVRFLLGIAIGGDYAIAPTLVAEFAPKKYRAVLVSFGPTMWTVGYVASFFVGIYFVSFGPDAWKYMLASSAVPALFVLFLRWTTPESPRWLVLQGRDIEALAILKKYVNPNATLKDLELDKISSANSNKKILGTLTGRRIVFMSTIWICQVVPYFAVFTFLPTILSNLSIANNSLEILVINGFLLLGSVAGLFIVNWCGRREFAIYSFLALTIATLGVSLGGFFSFTWVLIFFSIFAFVASSISVLDVVYPTELFPTEIRATATGICVSASRIGAAIGTFLMPIGMTYWGTNTIIFIAALICGVGLIVSILYAPETRGLSLNEAASKINK
ncbi:sugar porter family MFS transporter [Acinetobacter baumannii]|nr:sugar porter family MFS transporter [Acinetobacter baumannii]